MPFRSSLLLQFDELRAVVARLAGSAGGRKVLEQLEPSSDRNQVESALVELSEGLRWNQDAVEKMRFDRVPELGRAIGVLRVEGVRLEGEEILRLFSALELAGEYRGLLISVRTQFPRLALRGQSLADLRQLTRRWRPAFLPEGTLADGASVALNRIRRDLEKQKRAIQESLERFMRAHRDDGTLQEDFVTIREDRYVVPVVAGQKGRVDGVVHGASGSGRTLFLEPLETIGLNNQLVRLRDDEAREEDRILHEITTSLREHEAEIASTAEALAQLDAIFAKAEFAGRFNAIVPRFHPEGNERRLVLERARHPLLEAVLRKEGRPIVPISFALDQERRCLLISGPNTGGKTVTLKTAGLLTLMAHAALPVPAETAEFPLVDDVLADIGDQQSIEQSLSSFSGHLLHVKAMLEEVTADSLVLLDELGRATDPEEGGALGVAILDEFRKSGAFCLASTHLLPLKLYGARTANVLNASMGFDDATLEPTYQLRLGLPGRSAGLDIAQRLRMPEYLLKHAREVLPRMETDFEELLTDLERQRREAERSTAEMQAATVELARRQGELEQQWQRRETQRQRAWDRKSQELIADFEARAMLAIDRFGETGRDQPKVEQARRLVGQTRREFAEEAEQVMRPPETQGVVPRQEPVETRLAPGMRIRLRDVREPATILRLLKNGGVEIQAGALRMQVAAADVVEVIPPEAGPQKQPARMRVERGPSWDVSARELNLIGQRADEATQTLDKFLDSAVIASVNRVRIVHGHGMGVLKRTVSEMLQANPHVERFYQATPAEGGSGATVVELRA